MRDILAICSGCCERVIRAMSQYVNLAWGVLIGKNQFMSQSRFLTWQCSVLACCAFWYVLLSAHNDRVLGIIGTMRSAHWWSRAFKQSWRLTAAVWRRPWRIRALGVRMRSHSA